MRQSAARQTDSGVTDWGIEIEGERVGVKRFEAALARSPLQEVAAVKWQEPLLGIDTLEMQRVLLVGPQALAQASRRR